MADIDIEHGPFIVDLPIKRGDFPIAILVYQRVVSWHPTCFFNAEKK